MKTNLSILISLFAFIQAVQAQNTWLQKAYYPGTGVFRTSGFSIGNYGYIGTGAAPYTVDFWAYDPTNDTWTQKADFGGPTRYDAIGLSIGNKGYIGTGCLKGFNGIFDFLRIKIRQAQARPNIRVIRLLFAKRFEGIGCFTITLFLKEFFRIGACRVSYGLLVRLLSQQRSIRCGKVKGE